VTPRPHPRRKRRSLDPSKAWPSKSSPDPAPEPPSNLVSPSVPDSSGAGGERSEGNVQGGNREKKITFLSDGEGVPQQALGFLIGQLTSRKLSQQPREKKKKKKGFGLLFLLQTSCLCRMRRKVLSLKFNYFLVEEGAICIFNERARV